ncbi:hypothetical protein AAIH25_12985 [Arthrobacter crystallopoietes]|jgi:hypothetical protein|uniref:hypothetical protein n=1 Tax=Micrococcaceae TaxID=1268 RepID=UPI0021C97239|nr:hypothetical protein [Arthrobacter sp. Marseille-P9274]
MTAQRQPADPHESGLPPAFNLPSGQQLPGATAAGQVPVRPSEQENARRRRLTSRGWGTAIAGGLLVALLGTNLHSQVWFTAGQAYPWGAAAALLFAAAAMVWVGLRTMNVLAAGLTGIIAYVLVGLMASGLFGEPLIVTATSADKELAVAIAGRIWTIGLAVMVILSVAVTAWALKPRR